MVIMKNIFSIVLLLVAVSTSVMATDEKPTSSTGAAIVKDGAVFKLFYKGTRTSNVKVSIFNESNQIVFTEVIKNVEGFIRPYNFSSLKEGNYTVILEGEDGKIIEKINYRSGEESHFANVLPVKGEDGKFLVMVSNKQNSTIGVNIYKNNELVFRDSENTSGDFGKVYNLKDLKGNIVLEVVGNGGVIKSFTL
jgi:hypothetical protein